MGSYVIPPDLQRMTSRAALMSPDQKFILKAFRFLQKLQIKRRVDLENCAALKTNNRLICTVPKT